MSREYKTGLVEGLVSEAEEAKAEVQRLECALRTIAFGASGRVGKRKKLLAEVSRVAKEALR